MRKIALVVAICACVATPVKADIVVFDNKAAFLGATGATEAANFDNRVGGAYNPAYNEWNMGYSITLQDLRFDSQSREFWIRDWTDHLNGLELAISLNEDMDVTVIGSGADVFSLGFELVEPENIAAFVDSTFTVTLLSGVTTVNSFTFNAPNDQAAFIGVWSTPDQGFNAVQIRETIGGEGNEFFGEFYIGTEPVPVPVPGAVLLGMLGLSVAGVKLRKRI